MKFLKILSSVLVFFCFSFFIIKPVWAITFDLIAPSDTLTSGQEVPFTINIDTQATSLSTTQIGVTYETQYLELLNVLPGDTFSTITFSTPEPGKIVISASNATPFSGSGVFATVNFKLIAQSPGSTELCALYNPSTQPTPLPTQPAQPTQPAVYPTAPVSGSVKNVKNLTLGGVIFLTISSLSFILSRKKPLIFKKRN
ncbi:MAG: cohesin domain-containing protein [Microgenomates group bacterium]|jgi:hypothetical protein|nr:cohesin domain-containing protein [Microgenomates group bacterium]